MVTNGQFAQKIRIAGITPESVVDGPGLRVVVYFQGCSHGCQGCHNPDTWPSQGGREMTVGELAREIRQHVTPLTRGITITGGEPFDQREALEALFAHRSWYFKDLDIVVYTGYTYEELVKNKDICTRILPHINYLIDGPFIQGLKQELPFRGSSNQRILSLKEGVAVEVEGTKTGST